MKKLILLVLLISCSVYAVDTRRDFLIYYDDPNWESASWNLAQRTWIASKYDWGIGQTTVAHDSMLSIDSTFMPWFRYNTFQDNAPSHPDFIWLDSVANADGWDDDSCYMHFYNDTWYTIDGETRLVLGYGGPQGTADSLPQARIYAYTWLRIQCNYSTSWAREWHKKQVVSYLENLATDVYSTSTHYANGIFWDNTSPALWNMGTFVDTGGAGQVREHPTHAKIDKIGSGGGGDNWWYDGNIKTFHQELMDTFALSSEWHPDGATVYNMLNTAGGEIDAMATDTIATHIFIEFAPSITRTNYGSFGGFNAFDTLCNNNGVIVCYSPNSSTSIGSWPGSYTKEQVLHGNLAWFYASRTDSSYFFQQATNSPSNKYEYDTLVWCGSMDYDVGEPDAPYDTTQTGVDPVGQNYQIFNRSYNDSTIMVYARPKNWDHNSIATNTAVTITLGTPMVELFPDGTFGSTVSTFDIRNAEGKIFVLEGAVEGLPVINKFRGVKVRSIE